MSKFDEALKISFSAAQDYREALNDVDSLLADLARAVHHATAGAVAIDRHRVGPFPDMDRAAERESGLGVEPEDGSQSWIIVAAAKGQERALWEISYSPNGYPITVVAPDGSEITCVTREDLEQTFVELLQQGATGRKIKLLQEHSTKQAS